MIQVDDEQGPPVLAGDLAREQRASGRDAGAEHERTVGVEHVLHGARSVIWRLVLRKLVSGRNRSIFRAAATGTPAAVGDAQGHSGIEPGAIDPRLPAADQSLQLHDTDCIARRRTVPSRKRASRRVPRGPVDL